MMAKPRALVIGGSLGGLYAALTLRDAGWQVDVFERSRHALDDRGAGIVLQPDTVHYLEARGLLASETISTETRWRRDLDRAGGILHEAPMRQRFTTWSALYRVLRASAPEAHYHAAATLTAVGQEGGRAMAHFADGREAVGDLLVGADGARSTVRQHLSPGVAPDYAGYVAWRGVIDEGGLSVALGERFADAFTFFHYSHGQILCYPIPGARGELGKGQRRLNWVWYMNAGSGEPLRRLLTDRRGTLRESSVPPGEAPAELIGDVRATAARLLPAPFAELVAATAEPFLQAIEDLATPRMAGGRVCLIGDAAFVVRPHTAASTLKAALDAVALGRHMLPIADAVPAALDQWQRSQRPIGRHVQELGRRLGDQSGLGGQAHGPIPAPSDEILSRVPG